MSESQGAAHSSQSGATKDPSDIIKVTVKTLKQKEHFEVAQSSTIQEFKKEVAKRFKTTPDLLVLIFAGKVLQDQDTLSQHGVHSGVSIHVVIRSQKKPEDGLAGQGRAITLMPPPSHSDSNFIYLGSMAGLQNPGLTHDNLSTLLTSSQEIVAETMDNLVSRILSSGLDLNTINNNAFLLGFLLGVIGLHLLNLDSTEVLDLVSSIQEHDLLLHRPVEELLQSSFMQNILEDTDLLRDLIMSNPLMQQLAEENPEIGQVLADPHTIREALEASCNPAIMQEMIRNHDVAMNNLESLPGGYSALEQMYREVEEPFLDAVRAQLGNNPFASLDRSPRVREATVPAGTENRRPLPNPWAPRSDRGSDHPDGSDGHLASSSVGDSLASLSLGPAAGAVVPNSGVVQSMVQQLTENPELMQNLERALTNPNSPAQMLLNSRQAPACGHCPHPGQWAQQLPPQLEDSEILSLLRNPRALQAFLQIQLGLHTLSTEAPELLSSLEDSRAELESMEDSTQTSEVEEDEVLESDEDEEEEDQEEMDKEVAQIRFETQMEQLSALGFRDQGANLQALLDAGGDIRAAVEILEKAPPSDKVP